MLFFRAGLSFQVFPRQFELAPGGELTIRIQRYNAVPMWWIATVQREEFWTYHTEASIREEMQFPRDGMPFSYGTHKVTTLTPGELARVQLSDLIGEEVPLEVFKRNPEDPDEWITDTKPPDVPFTSAQLHRWSQELQAKDPDGSIRRAVMNGSLTSIARVNVDRSSWPHLSNEAFEELVGREEAVYKQRERVLIISQLFAQLIRKQNAQDWLNAVEDWSVVQQIENQHPDPLPAPPGLPQRMAGTGGEAAPPSGGTTP